MTIRFSARVAHVCAASVTVFALFFCGRDAASATPDPAARGLDAFVELPAAAAPGAAVAIDVRTFGFPTAVEPLPLGEVKVEAVWNGNDEAPRSIVTDSDGVGTLDLVMPPGSSPSASLMLAMSRGTHRRTRTFQIRRAQPLDLDLHVEDAEVAPGSSIPTWVLVRDRDTGTPASGVELFMTLLEGGVPREKYVLHTDAAGYAAQVVPIPEVDEPTFGWRLQVTTTQQSSNLAFADLVPREDVPAQPTLSARFEAARSPAGSKTMVRVRLKAATGEGMARVPVRYLVTNESEGDAPTGSRWEKDAKSGVTDDVGELAIPYEVPSVGFATQKRFTVRAEIDGREREATSVLDIVAKSAPSIEIVPEAGDVLAGIEQRLFVSVKDGWNKPVANADLKIEGDGLSATVRTNARGLADVAWKTPKDVGAARKVGPCSGGVATTLTVTAAQSASPELSAAGAVAKCLRVDRTSVAIMRPKDLISRSGESIGFDVAFADGAPKTGPLSVSVSGQWGGRTTSAWVKGQSGEVRVPTTAGWLFTLQSRAPRGDGPAIEAAAHFVVKPKILPKLTSKITGGRLAPGGMVEVEAKLVDEAGAPLQGSVTGVVYDRFARNGDEIDASLDTRLSLCTAAGIQAADCDPVLAGDAAAMPLLRAALARRADGEVTLGADPGGTAKEEMRQTFNVVLKNLEGAVFQSTGSPESLRDVLRKGPKGNEFNPEILTLVTSVLATPPTTPGGEPFSLGDLRSIDSQVEYDVVARRVARLKMFRVLEAVRRFRNAQDLDANEPMLGDPNAILRRLLTKPDDQDGVEASALLDPWGGTMQFVKAGGPGLPFISALPGWELHAPGPDGRLGTGDDVKDPFARVVKSGTPYARAMGEDKVVDSRLDMRVGEETVSKWSSLLSEFTGTELATGGEGFGSGHGRLSGSHRSKPPSVRMGATQVSRDKSAYVLSAPVRTDKDGVARLKLPLGADETTYRVLLVSLPDAAGPAASFVDVATSLPLSVRVNGGTKWIAGDSPEVGVRVTNRTDAPIHATVRVQARDAAELARGESSERTVDVPKKGSVTVPVKVRAKGEGEAVVVASVKGGGLEDSIEHHVGVGPAGRHLSLARARWVSESVVIDGWSADDITTLEGAPSLLLEGSFDPALASLMDSLGPDHLGSADAAADAIEAFERLRREWEKREPALSARSSMLRDQAFGRLSALHQSSTDEREAGMVRRALYWLPGNPAGQEERSLPEVPECPPEHPASPGEAIREIEGEPAPKGGGVAACWDAAVTNGMRAAKDERDPVMLARLLLAFADRSHRQSLASELAPELAKLVSLKPSGEIVLGGAHTASRSAKAVVYAALVRATALGFKPSAPTDTLIGWLLVQRAPDGGFGSSVASRAAVEALTVIGSSGAPKRVTVTELDREGEPIGGAREVRLTGSTRLALDRRTKRVMVAVVPTAGERPVAGGGFLARLDQPALRAFSFTPSPQDLSSPLTLEVKWPGNASTEHTASLEVRVVAKASSGMHIAARIPLPPGASLAEPVEGVKQIDGALLMSTEAGGSDVSVPTLIPLRFAFAGDFTLPESTARALSDDSLRARALASRLRVVGPARRP